MFRRLAIGLALQLTLGCSAARVAKDGYVASEALIDAADNRHRPPRRGAARALAAALVAQGNAERARDVLLGDFRRGGQIASLIALADLERSLGRDGVAAVHYTRVLSLDRTALRGRRDVCTLLRARAAAWVSLGEGAAALDDLDAIAAVCAGEQDRRLRARAQTLLASSLRARRLPSACGAQCDHRMTPAQLDAAVLDARRQGSLAVRELARRESLSLPSADIIALLIADVRGAAGRRLLDDDELRSWVGEAGPGTFAPELRGLPAPEGAYVRLRLERVLARSPEGGLASPTERMLWLDRASVIEGVVRWRLLAYAGDLVAAEQDLVARWRPTADADRGSPSTPETDVVRPAERHWSLRIPTTATNFLDLLMFARLRDAADDRDLAFELTRRVLGAAEHDQLEGAAQAVRDEVEHALGWGRPWLALGLADVSATADVEPLRRAAATGVLLSETLCEGPCEEDRADLETLERTLGESWVSQQRAALREYSRGRPQPRLPAGPCPGLDEVLAPGARSVLAQALERAHAGESVGVPRGLVSAIESDPTLACGARFVMPLLVDRDAAVSAARLSDYLVHGARPPVSRSLTLYAELALLGHQPMRAEHLAILAATAGDPREAWRHLARFARRTKARDLEVLALRELLLHAPGFEDDAVRRELVAHTIVDGARTWGVGETPAGRESVSYVVDEHLLRLPPSQRWAERAAVFDAVARHGLEPAVVAIVERTLLPVERVAELGVGAAAVHTTNAASWSPHRLAREVDARRLAGPPLSATVFANVGRMIPLRLALARTARDWGVRRRAAIGLAIFGSEQERADGAAALLSMTSATTRHELERLLLDRPAAIAPWSPAVSTSVVPDDDVLLHLLFGLSPEHVLWLGRASAVVP